MVILGDIDYIRPFSDSNFFKVVMDGTFKSSSNSFFQLYIIHGFIAGQSFPLLYCFLGGKTERLYTKMFETRKIRLLDENVIFNPNVIQIDFEQATFNAIKRVSPNADVKGCYFHFKQAIWRMVQKLELVSLFHQDINLKYAYNFVRP
ncbi:hypothetical protein DMUE_4516 [Dictyocoela muelleri]|nr:hypothetical protein DMUE_4516 [Dictyocoela muelleri]